MASDKPIYHLYISFLRHILFGYKFVATMDITDRCNLNCSYCYHKTQADEKSDLSLEVFEKKFSKYKKNGLKLMTFIGGEPSLRMDVLLLAEKYFPFIAVFTNGLISIPKSFDRRIILSLNGLKEEHEKMKAPGTFDKIIENYQGDDRVVPLCLLSKLNYAGPQRLKEYISFVKTMGWKGLKVEYYISQNGKEPDALELTQAQYQEITEVLLEELKKKDSILLTTPKCLKFQLQARGFPAHCCVRDETLVIKTDDSLCFCVGEENDCLRCRFEGRYSVPFYKFIEWHRLKSVRKRFVLR